MNGTVISFIHRTLIGSLLTASKVAPGTPLKFVGLPVSASLTRPPKPKTVVGPKPVFLPEPSVTGNICWVNEDADISNIPVTGSGINDGGLTN